MDTALSVSVDGIQRAFAEHGERAARIAKGLEHGDITKDLAEMPQAGMAIKANVAAIRAYDQMVGSLLDILA